MDFKISSKILYSMCSGANFKFQPPHHVHFLKRICSLSDVHEKEKERKGWRKRDNDREST